MVKTKSKAEAKKPKVQWGLLVYMAADNDLNVLADATLANLAALGSKDVWIIVQKDTGSAERYILAGGKKTGAPVPVPEDEGGLPPGKVINMGDPDVLRKFVTWGLGTAAFEKTALVVWNHGGGTLALDKGAGNDSLTNKELKKALEGQPLDLVGCDACLTGTVELASVLGEVLGERDALYVAPETNTPIGGWPYQSVLQQLMDNPEMDVEALAQLVLNSFAQLAPEKNTVVLGGWRLRQVPALVASVDKLGAALVACQAEGLPLREARKRMIMMEDPDCVDFGSCLTQLEKLVQPPAALGTGPQVSKAQQKLLDATAACRAALKQAKLDVRSERNLSGLSILFPRPESVRSRLFNLARRNGQPATAKGRLSPQLARRNIIAGLRGARRWQAFIRELLPSEEEIAAQSEPSPPPTAPADGRPRPAPRVRPATAVALLK